MKKQILFLMALLGLVVSACTVASDGTPDEIGKYETMADSGVIAGPDGPGEPVPPGGGDGGEVVQPGAGIVTAAEWNDLQHWPFWGKLMTGEYSRMNTYWGLSTAKRFAVKVSDGAGKPVRGLEVQLLAGEAVKWEAVTDYKGEANLWLAVENIQESTSTADCRIKLGNVLQAEAPALWPWDAEAPVVNEYTVATAPSLSSNVDIAFVVDATGSMGDEIAFLKQDLQSILTKVADMNTDCSIFTGTVFYRDKDGDEYITRHSAFTTDISATMDFIGKQWADGGGDIPEAVHTALEVSLTQLQWHGDAYAKMAFLVLDAPAHKDHEGVIESLQKSIRSYAAKGIKLIPVFCSSYEKECEFMSRQFAILTGGTYVFLTNDSGVGGDHLEATVGEYQVERLNDLIFRLISQYIG